MDESGGRAQVESTEKTRLLRILGVGFGLAVAVGGMVGVGILRTPGIVAANLDAVWLLMGVWVFGGVYTLIAANSYAELGTLQPESGGPYVFAKRAYGEFGGFLIGWSDWFLNNCALAYMAVAAGEYFVALFSVAEERVPVVAVVILLLFFVLHWLGLRAGSGAQKLMSLLKILFLLAVVAACFIFGGKPAAAANDAPASTVVFADSLAAFIAVILSAQAVIETYAGYNSVVYFSEENTDPGRNIPRALFGGVLTVTTVYLLVNLALVYVLPVSEIAASKLPVADAARIVFGETGGTIITVLSFVSILGIVNAVVMQTPRTLYAMSRDGLFLKSGATVNEGGTPTAALVLTVLLAVIMAATGTFETLFAVVAFMGVTVDCSVFLALFVLRKKEPDAPRPFEAFGYPFLPLSILVVSIFLLIAYLVSNTANSVFALTVMISIYLLFRLARKRSK